MRIAFISYEYPPETALGGIATYIHQAAAALTRQGNDVEVFCGSTGTNAVTFSDKSVLVHQLPGSRAAFPDIAASMFAARHDEKAFDVLEGPDFLAEALPASELRRQVPYVVTLHTPFSLVRQINSYNKARASTQDWIKRTWFLIRARRRLPPDFAQKVHLSEKRNAWHADEIVAPSQAIGKRMQRFWALNPSRLSLVPYPFDPPSELLGLPIGTNFHRVTFVGRLEWRKGVQDLARAIPLVLEQCPETKFRFVGASTQNKSRGDMADYIRAQAGPKAKGSLEFAGQVSRKDLAGHLAETDVCTFPSHWESFGFVVLEAMAAGRPIVCTTGSGMAELTDQGRFADLVPPRKPKKLAEALVRLLKDSDRRRRLATIAREEGLAPYRIEAITKLQIASYERAILRHKQSAFAN